MFRGQTQGMDESYVGHKWGMGGMHGVCQGMPGVGGIKRAIGLTGSLGGEHQTRRAIPSPLHLLDTRHRFVKVKLARWDEGALSEGLAMPCQTVLLQFALDTSPPPLSLLNFHLKSAQDEI